ncbi:MAG: hypothetical protein WAQ27_00240 [Candidatus Microsaccharimonas sp.]
MITITREGKAVKIKAEYGIEGWYSNFENTANSELDAILRHRKLSDNLWNLVSEIRREAYELGWKEKTAKKTKKRDWFNGNINSKVV